MRHVQVRMSLLSAGLFLIACPAFAATVDFDEVPTGTIFGFSSGDPAGVVVHREDKIDMSLEPFFAGDFEAYFDAEPGPRRGYRPRKRGWSRTRRLWADGPWR